MNDIPSRMDSKRLTIHGDVGQRSQIALTRILDKAFLNSFTLQMFIKKEVFGELFQVKMAATGEKRILRVVKKAVLRKESMNDQVDDFRFDLEELLELEHPNIAQIFEYQEDDHNFYILEQYCQGTRLFSEIQNLSEMT